MQLSPLITFQIPETFPNGEYWIGGNDYAVDGVFVWDSGKAITFKNWEPGEPDNFYFISYCMKANSHWRWHDYPCLTLYESICEKDPTHNGRSLHDLISNCTHLWSLLIW